MAQVQESFQEDTIVSYVKPVRLSSQRCIFAEILRQTTVRPMIIFVLASPLLSSRLAGIPLSYSVNIFLNQLFAKLFVSVQSVLFCKAIPFGILAKSVVEKGHRQATFGHNV